VDRIKELLKLLPHSLQITFAIYCCNDIKHLMNKESVICLELVEKWLATPHLVSREELYAAANATAYANATTSATAYAAAYAANATAYAADAANAANAAANATAYAGTASYAARREEKLKQYEVYLVNMLKEMPELCKVIYGVYL